MICKICNKEFKALTNTHLDKHNITPKEYEAKFNCKTVPEDWMIGKKNSFFGKKHEWWSGVKTQEYRDNASKRKRVRHIRNCTQQIMKRFCKLCLIG